MTDLEELNEEEMLMRAIAMSLEEEEEGVSEEELGSIKVQESGELLKKASKVPDTTKSGSPTHLLPQLGNLTRYYIAFI